MGGIEDLFTLLYYTTALGCYIISLAFRYTYTYIVSAEDCRCYKRKAVSLARGLSPVRRKRTRVFGDFRQQGPFVTFLVISILDVYLGA